MGHSGRRAWQFSSERVREMWGETIVDRVYLGTGVLNRFEFDSVLRNAAGDGRP